MCIWLCTVVLHNTATVPIIFPHKTAVYQSITHHRTRRRTWYYRQSALRLPELSSELGSGTRLACCTHQQTLHNKTRQMFITGCLTDQQVWFTVDFQETFSRKFCRICSFVDIYRAGSLTLGITLILFTQAIAQLKDIYRALIAPISINPGLLQDVFIGLQD